MCVRDEAIERRERRSSGCPSDPFTRPHVSVSGKEVQRDKEREREGGEGIWSAIKGKKGATAAATIGMKGKQQQEWGVSSIDSRARERVSEE